MRKLFYICYMKKLLRKLFGLSESTHPQDSLSGILNSGK